MSVIDEMGEEKPGFKLTGGLSGFLAEFSRLFTIGILGQYGKDFREFLAGEKLLPFFAHTEIRDDYSLTKPDPRYFEVILKNCGCRAGESVMIGDRIDKDITPARAVGMGTIRLRTGIHKNQEPRRRFPA